MEARKRALLSLLTFLISSLLLSPAIASKKVYIVYLGGHSHGKDATIEDFNRATDSHHELLGSFLESKEKAQEAIIYSYNKHINGFAAYLEEEEALEISRHPDVMSVFPNGLKQLHTTRTWSFLGLERNGYVSPSSIWTKSNYGEDVIIAHLDTGVWPESASFRDDGMGPVPAKWKGSCQNNTKAGVACNRKLIGAKYYDKGPMHEDPTFNPRNSTARDTEGHGTHTLSTAGGSFVPHASLFGFANGTAKGGSPKARVATYKVCWEMGCFDADILAAFDDAIHDGVDVLSISVGGYTIDYLTDSIALGSFHAVLNGITVACSAGNSGPFEASVANTPPWVMTVAASTVDREFIGVVTLGNKKQLVGMSMTEKGLPSNKLYPMIYSYDAKTTNASINEARLCYENSLDPKKVKGKIVICLRGDILRLEKGFVVHQAGGVGMIIVNTMGLDMGADDQMLPATMISEKDGLALQSYMNSTKSPMGTISAGSTVVGVKPAPKIAKFSSRGPNQMSLQILKPDITAPGVDVLASYSEAVPIFYTDYDHRRWPFTLMSGTSMSCPHVAGIIGLLRKIYPHWSPAAIRSAIMTTARTQDNTGMPIMSNATEAATPFSYGAGHINPNRAMNPGLVYDMGTEDYLDFLCTFGYNSTQMSTLIGKHYTCSSNKMMVEDMNNPSFSIPALNRTMTVTRTVKNVGHPGTYRAGIKAPAGILVSVKPQVLKFKKVGEEKKFQVTFKSTEESVGAGFSFGMLIWSDGKHYVTSPMAVNALS